MAAEPKRVCSVLTINQVPLLGHKLHVDLGKTYFKKLYLPKIISRNKAKPFFFFFTSKTHLCKQNTLQIVKQKAGKSLPHRLSSSHKHHKHPQRGNRVGNLPHRSPLFRAALTVRPPRCQQKRPCHPKPGETNALGCKSQAAPTRCLWDLLQQHPTCRRS